MSSIPLHSKRGLDPHLTVCPRCGGTGNSITLGELRKTKLPSGQWVYSNRGKTRQTEQDLRKQGVITSQERFLSWQEVRECDKIPDSEPCDKCKAELKEWADIVASGGVHFRCLECHQAGVIKPSEFATAVREAHKLTNGEPCGIEFEKCEQHEAKS